MRWQIFGGHLLSLNNLHNVCESRLNSWKVIVGVFFVWKFPSCSPRMIFETLYVSSLFHLSSWIEQYMVCGNRLIGWKVIVLGIFHENSSVAPLEWNLAHFMFQFCSACRAESIGMLFLEISWMVEKLLGYFFMKISWLLPWNEIWKFFYVSKLFRWWSWIDRYVASENQLNSWKVNVWVVFRWKFHSCSPRMKFETFFIVSAFYCLDFL